MVSLQNSRYMMRLFISYAHKDKRRVQELSELLRAGGHEPWFDRELVPGQSWQDQLMEAIMRCDAFIYALTPDSVSSEWCQWEFAKAIENRKPIIPVLLQRDTAMPTALNSCQWVDFSDGATAEATARLLHGLYKIAVTIPVEDTPPPPDNPVGVPASVVPTVSMVAIPSGAFIMGSFRGWEDEQPQHQIMTSSYKIGRFPVSENQFSAFATSSDYFVERYWTRQGLLWLSQNGIQAQQLWKDIHSLRKNYPIVGVNWYEATAFASWLSELTNAHYRLPTEAEWEKAAKGPQGLQYPWGNEWATFVCNTQESNIDDLTAFERFSPQGDSGYGCVDMAGNVREWTSSLYRNYPYNPNDGREDIESSGLRVIRGSSFLGNRSLARCSSRDGASPDTKRPFIGFRLASDSQG